METQKYNIVTRLLICILYLFVFLSLCRWFAGSWQFLYDANNNFNMLFVSGALLLLFGTYLAEPYFTKPLDVLTNSTSIILALLAIRRPSEFIGYYFLFVGAVILEILAVLTIVLHAQARFLRTQKSIFDIITKLGSSKVIFSTIYLLTLVSYFRETPIEFCFFLTFWIVFISDFVVSWFVEFFIGIYNIWHKKFNKELLGVAFGCENPFLYKVEVDCRQYKGPVIKKGDIVIFSEEDSSGILGIVVDVRFLIHKKWLSIYILHREKSILKLVNDKVEYVTQIQDVSKNVYRVNINELSQVQKEEIINNHLFKNKDLFVGYVIEGSNIDKIKFLPILDEHDERYSRLTEGTIVVAAINGRETLFQIIGGQTSKEVLENHNKSGYIVCVAQKLGQYNYETNTIDSVKWLPNMYTPLFFKSEQQVHVSVTERAGKEINKIGVLPNTSMRIDIKDWDSLVTHNTAILGILGIGKSCLTFELIQKIIHNTDVQVICFDITNEYHTQLPNYINPSLLEYDTEHTFFILNNSADHVSDDDVNKAGNLEGYKEMIKKDLIKFLFGQNNIPDTFSPSQDKRVRIYNPDFHKVTKGEKLGYRIITTQLVQTEKVRIICEELYKVMMKFPTSKKARTLLVFEEAHSLIPEWNSISNPADSNAVNGTAKIILQGRKYGLGSFVVTQRTANISKSVLNQCNTIFALRVFDDTGKAFLENYIGGDYSNLLPTLEERHAIAVGKALKLRLPIMIRLNDKNDVILKEEK